MKNSEKVAIKNKFLQIEITKTGAELCSIKNNENPEFIWQANPDIWGSSAPVLFPIIGALKDAVFYYEGKEYSVPKHGFIRHNNALHIIYHKEDSRNPMKNVWNPCELGSGRHTLRVEASDHRGNSSTSEIVEFYISPDLKSDCEGTCDGKAKTPFTHHCPRKGVPV